MQIVAQLPKSLEFKNDEAWVKPKPKAVEEDEYYKRVEEIIRRDFYPDLVKLAALREFERMGGDSSSQAPSVLLRSTGKSGLSRTLGGSKRVVDPVDDFMAMKRAELGLKPLPSDRDKKSKKMGLNEFLRRFTSEDNASFQELHEMD
eukprot:CAMPEP_0170457720 /NCGR_PEP_ID=MMETSP0123-20130129/4916_1 /TAXON_ID=182087 /ORGANISM="Favella ehrenbergii, Strain Fehren 1" /LENGTH=146 /DNA_ID=CAMNT_0010721603 /DNA_START=64 /DNA_END=504 /DNA_ORIENTATION=-